MLWDSDFPPSFDTPNLSEAVEAMKPSDLDLLPFGVILLDPYDLVLFRNRAEDELFPQKLSALGRMFFVDVAPCLNNGYFKGRIEKARKHGTLNITFDFISDFAEPSGRELRVRAQSAKNGGTWIFIKRA